MTKRQRRVVPAAFRPTLLSQTHLWMSIGSFAELEHGVILLDQIGQVLSVIDGFEVGVELPER